MIKQVKQASQIHSKPIAQVDYFNSTLPVLLKVLKKTKPQHYLLQVGKKVLESKSNQELQIGARYYSVIKKNSLGTMMLTSLKSQSNPPKTPLLLDIKTFEEVLKQTSLEEFKEFGIEGMMKAKNKEEFSTFGFFLMGLQKNILSFMLEDKYQEKHYIQIKKQKNSLEFFAFYANFGAIAGRVFYQKGEIKLELEVQFPSVIEYLQSQQKELKGIGEIRLILVNHLEPLFAKQDTLLDLKV